MAMVQSPTSLDEQLAMWRIEQQNVASQVIVITSPQKTQINTYNSSPHSILPQENHREKLYGGVDVTFAPREEEKGRERGVAVYVILRGSEIVYSDHHFFETDLPYVSSYLSFREIEPLEELVKCQMTKCPHLTPDAILVDGNGIMHCRKAGLACFLGVRTGLKTIGVGKTLYCHDGITHDLVKWNLEKGLERLVSECDDEEDDRSYVVMTDQEFIDISKKDVENTITDKTREYVQKLPSSCLGYAMKLKGGSGTIWGATLVAHGGDMGKKQNQRRGAGTKNPIFVSVGHKISLEDAVKICAELSLARIPEPVRIADLEGRRLLREA